MRMAPTTIEPEFEVVHASKIDFAVKILYELGFEVSVDPEHDVRLSLTPLHRAVLAQSPPEVLNGLAADVDVDARDDLGHSALFYAVAACDADLVLHLVTHLSCTVTDDVVRRAVDFRAAPVLDVLLATDSIDSDRACDFALYALRRDDWYSFSGLIHVAARENSKMDLRRHLKHFVVGNLAEPSERGLSRLSTLLRLDPLCACAVPETYPEDDSFGGQTALMLCVSRRLPFEYAETIADSRPSDVDVANERDGRRTALHYACGVCDSAPLRARPGKQRNIDFVQLLIERGADVEAKCVDGHGTLVDCAALCRDLLARSSWRGQQGALSVRVAMKRIEKQVESIHAMKSLLSSEETVDRRRNNKSR